MRRRTWLVLIPLCLLLFCLTSCGKASTKENTPSYDIAYEAEKEYLTFEETLERATDVMIAQYCTTHSYDGYAEHEFAVKRMLKGETIEDKIFVFEAVGYNHIDEIDVTVVSGVNEYAVNSEYLLVLERQSSIYYDHDRYLVLSDIYWPINNPDSATIYNQKISRHSSIPVTEKLSEVGLKYIEATINEMNGKGISDTQQHVLSKYTTSSDPNVIVSEAECIYTVKLLSLQAEGKYNGTETYYCLIKDVIKGSPAQVELSDGIFVVFFADTVETGETYTLLLNRPSEYSRIYTLSSYSSVVDPEDTGLIAAIENAAIKK